MLLMKAHAEDRNVQASTYPLPRGVRVEYRVGAHEEQPGAGSLTWNTSWTTLRWMWTDETGASRATGELTWPTSDDTAEAHAAALLDVAERSLVEGCPPAPLPASLASPSSQPRVEQALWARLRGYPPPPGCAAR
jgi:hypothetical protein